MRSITMVCLVALTISGCTQRDNVRPIDLDPTYAFPIINTTVSLDELMDNFSSTAILEVNNNGLLTYKLDTTINIYDGNDFDGVVDFESNVLDTLSKIDLTPLLSQSITAATLKAGKFTYFVDVFNPGNFSLLIEIPDLVKNGQSFRVERTDFYSTSILDEVSIEGYEIVSPSEEVSLRMVLRERDSRNLEIPREAKIGLEELKFSYLQGRSMFYTFLNKIDSLQPKLFPDNLEADIFFSDPSLRLTFNNSFGVPLEFTIDEILAKGINGDVQSLQSPIFNQPIAINYPLISEKGEFKSTVVDLDMNNSNIVDFFNILPQEFRYNFVSSAIYNASSSSDPDIFLMDTSRLDVELDFNLPLDLRIEELSFFDTLNYTLEINQVLSRSTAEFKLITENALPLTLKMQGYFLDFDGNPIDSLFDSFSEILGPATVDENGNVVEASTKEFFFTMNSETFQQIAFSDRLAIKASFGTSHQVDKTVKLFPESSLGIKLGVKLSQED